MKIYLSIKQMNFMEENNLIEHKIILSARDEEFFGYDEMVEIPDNNKFIKDTLNIVYKKDDKGNETKEIDSKQFLVREQETWNSFPLYEYKNGKIIDFNYNDFAYFGNTNRRMMLASKINALYNPSSELKILRKAIEQIIGHLDIKDSKNFEAFNKYNQKVENIIKNIQKIEIFAFKVYNIIINLFILKGGRVWTKESGLCYWLG